MAAACVVAVLVAGCGGRGDVLVVGMDMSYAPFEHVDGGGRPVGVSVDLARALGESLGREIELRHLNFDGLILALETGEIDLILSSMTDTAERRRSIGFSEPYVRTGICLLVGRDSGIGGLDDLREGRRRVVVRLGTTGESYAREHLPGVELVVLDDDGACVLQVVNGSVDAWIYDQLSVLRYAARQGDRVRALPTPLREEFWAIGLRKGDEGLKAEVDRFLREFRAAGGFESLAEKHLAEERAQLEALGVPFVFDVEVGEGG